MNQEEHDLELESELDRRAQQLLTLLQDQSPSQSPGTQTNALLTVRAGTGGLEAQAWALMLAGMYAGWAQRTGRAAQVLDHSPGAREGLRTTTMEIEASLPALGAEHGVHRLLRISPYDREDRKQTSMASVEVLPVPSEETSVEIRPADLKVQTFQAGGHGGQHVNKVATAVRIIHTPTGITATCRTERSQGQNKQNAMRLLTARVEQRFQEEREAESARTRGERPVASWGHRVRSYYLHSKRQVVDHRTGVRVEGAEQVLAGHIEPFLAEAP